MRLDRQNHGGCSVPLQSSRASRVWTGLVVMIACAWAPAAVAAPMTPTCTPPLPVNLSLALDVIIDEGDDAGPGSTGRLLFTATHREASGRPSAVFVSNRLTQGLAAGSQTVLLLSAAPDASCVVESAVEAVDGQPRLFYSAYFPKPIAPGDSEHCQVAFAVSAGSLARERVELTARPYDCAIDPDLSDNRVIFEFGGAGVVPLPEGVDLFDGSAPSTAWLVTLLLLLVTAARRAMRA